MGLRLGLGFGLGLGFAEPLAPKEHALRASCAACGVRAVDAQARHRRAQQTALDNPVAAAHGHAGRAWLG